MRENLEREFFSALGEITKITIDDQILKELRAWYPGKYEGDNIDLVAAQHDYFNIVMAYLTYEQIPITIETITAGYLYTVNGLKKYGLHGMNARVKSVMAMMRHKCQTTADALDNKLFI